MRILLEQTVKKQYQKENSIKAASSNERVLVPHVHQREWQPLYHYWRTVDTALNFQDYRTLCEWVKYYFLCAVFGAGDDIL